MTNARKARIFLGLNAAFSLLCGVLLLLFPERAAFLMLEPVPGWAGTGYIALGIGLVIFALDLLLALRDPYLTRIMVLLFSAADGIWVVASAALLALYGEHFTALGIWTVIGVACIVAVFAAGQALGARRIPVPEARVWIERREKVIRATVRRKVACAPARAWSVMADQPGYAEVADNLASVEVVSGQGRGMVRRCSDSKGGSWTEACDYYDEGSGYGFEVDTGAPDYPYPISKLFGRWRLHPAAGGAEFVIDIEITPKGNAVQRFLFGLLAVRPFRGVLLALAEAWAARMERSTRPASGIAAQEG